MTRIDSALSLASEQLYMDAPSDAAVLPGVNMAHMVGAIRQLGQPSAVERDAAHATFLARGPGACDRSFSSRLFIWRELRRPVRSHRRARPPRVSESPTARRRRRQLAELASTVFGGLAEEAALSAARVEGLKGRLGSVTERLAEVSAGPPLAALVRLRARSRAARARFGRTHTRDVAVTLAPSPPPLTPLRAARRRSAPPSPGFWEAAG